MVPISREPLKQPKHFNLLFDFFNFYISFAYLLGPISAMVTRPVQGPYIHIYFVMKHLDRRACVGIITTKSYIGRVPVGAFGKTILASFKGGGIARKGKAR